MKRSIFSFFTAATMLLLVSFQSWSQINCSIRIIANQSPSNPLQVTLTAFQVDSFPNCFGPNSLFRWDLGTGATLDGRTVTYTYNQAGMYGVCVTATTNTGFTVTDCDTIFVGISPTCPLNFDFQTGLPTIPLTYQFTPSDSLGCFTGFQWTWGDGTSTTTTNTNPVLKTYTAPGTYTVCLTGYRQQASPVEVCKNVLVTSSAPTVSLGGMVMADGNCFNGPITVELFSLDNQQYFVDSLNGWVDSCFYHFTIPQTPSRIWTVRATAVNNQDYVTTYLGDVLFSTEATLFSTPSNWQTLPTINLLGNYFDSLVAGNPNPQHIVTGQITGSGTIVTATIQGHNLSTTFQAGAARIIVLDANGNAVAIANVLPDGSFSIPALPEGNYQIRVDHPGVPSQPMPMQVTASGNIVNFNVTTSGVTIVTSIRSKDTLSSVRVYPNPASQQITVNGFSGKVHLLDMAGKTLQTVDSQSAINIESLPAGMFTLKGNTESGLPVTTRFVKK